MGEIYKAISNVMAEIGAIPKDKQCTQGSGFKYRGIDSVMDALHPILSRNKVFIVPEVLEQAREERQSKSGGVLTYSICKIKYTFYTEDGSNVSSTVIGEAMDSGDKATNKSMAIAFKYACFQVFCIPLEDDPDKDVHELKCKDKPNKPEQPKNTKPEPPKQDIKPSETSQNSTKTPLEQRVTTIYMRCKNGLKWTDANFKAWLKDAKEAGFIKSESSKTMSEADVIYIETEYLKLKKAKESAA